MQPRTVINKNTGPQTKYRKVQDSYKNTGIYRIYRTAGITATITGPTQPFIAAGPPDRVPASFGWGKGGNVS